MRNEGGHTENLDLKYPEIDDVAIYDSDEDVDPELAQEFAHPGAMKLEANDILWAVPHKQTKVRRKKKSRSKIDSDSFDFDFEKVSPIDSSEDESTGSGSSFEIVEAPTLNLNFQPDMPKTTLYLKNDELTPGFLVETYGVKYTESSCLPRSFAINISDELIEELTKAYGTVNLMTKAQLNFQVLVNNRGFYAPPASCSVVA